MVPPTMQVNENENASDCNFPGILMKVLRLGFMHEVYRLFEQ